MARKPPKAQQARRRVRESQEISVEALRGININFPDDVYGLAVWIARSDLALSTPTMQRATTLSGLARHFATLADSYDQPWTAETVLARFRQHGLGGNPTIRLSAEQAEAPAAFVAGDANAEVR